MKAASNKVLVDFVNGSGFFEADPEAWEVARRLSKNQKRKMERHGIIPPAFFQYLKQSGTFHDDKVIPKGPTTTFALLSTLDSHRYPSEQARSFGETLSRKIKEAHFPELKDSSGLQDENWEKLEQSANLKVRKRRTDT